MCDTCRQPSPKIPSLTSADGLDFLLLLSRLATARFPFLKLPPRVNSLIPCGLPVLLMLPLPLPLFDLLVLFLLLSALLLHLGLHLSSSPLLVVNKHHLGLVRPQLLEVVVRLLDLGRVDGPLVVAHHQHPRVRDRLVQQRAVFLVRQLRLRLLEPVEGVGRPGVPGLVRVDQQGLFAVDDLDVRLRHAGLEAEDGVGIEAERLENAVDLGILEKGGELSAFFCLRLLGCLAR